MSNFNIGDTVIFIESDVIGRETKDYLLLLGQVGIIYNNPSRYLRSNVDVKICNVRRDRFEGHCCNPLTVPKSSLMKIE